MLPLTGCCQSCRGHRRWSGSAVIWVRCFWTTLPETNSRKLPEGLGKRKQVFKVLEAFIESFGGGYFDFLGNQAEHAQFGGRLFGDPIFFLREWSGLIATTCIGHVHRSPAGDNAHCCSLQVTAWLAGQRLLVIGVLFRLVW